MKYIVPIVVLLFSVIIHEVAHGFVAYKRGDSTAKLLGRLTLNPISHIDIFGSIVLPAMLMLTGAPVFGWAKPVPVNMYNLKNPKRDMIFVSLAGITANFLLAVCAGALMFIIRTYFANADSLVAVYIILQYVIVVNIVLFIFNLIPIPPLDGSRVVLFLLPKDLAQIYAQIERYGFWIILILLMTNILWKIIGPIATFLIRLLSGSV
ncbi:MAG: site-2 protease family protein [Endomicrobiaceae bacterium]|nr:site-2 protease family protein [Endomicrobiaceae bacterium]